MSSFSPYTPTIQIGGSLCYLFFVSLQRLINFNTLYAFVLLEL